MSYAHIARKASAVAPCMRARIDEAVNGGGGVPPSGSRASGQLVPFPASRQAFVRKELLSVRDYDDLGAYKWLTLVVGKHLRRLRALGIDEALIAADVKALMAALGIGDTEKRIIAPASAV